MLHTKYQGSRPYGFRQEASFMVFPKQAFKKQVTQGWAIFGPNDII